jgi:hypothetical protein
VSGRASNHQVNTLAPSFALFASLRFHPDGSGTLDFGTSTPGLDVELRLELELAGRLGRRQLARLKSDLEGR